MAWTTPRTWVAGEIVRAATMNEHVRDNLNALRDEAAVRATGVAATDTAVLNDALAAAGAYGAGKRVLLEGDFLVNATILVPADTVLDGPRASITASADPGDDLIRVTGSRAQVRNLTVNDGGFTCVAIKVSVVDTVSHLEDVVIDGNTITCTAAASAGIWVWGTDRVSVRNNVLTNTAATSASTTAKGIAIHSNTATAGNVVDGVVEGNRITGFHRGYDSFGTGLRLRGRITGNVIKDCATVGIYAYHSPRNLIDGNDVQGCAHGGIFADSSADAESPSAGAPGNRVIGNRVHKCGTFTEGAEAGQLTTSAGIVTEELEGAVIAANTLTECAGDGIVLGGGTQQTSVVGNSITRCGKSGIVTDKNRTPVTTPVASLTITGNTVRLSGHHGMNMLGTQRSNLIAGNTITDNGLATATTYSGVHIDHTSDSAIAREFTISGNVLGNAFDSGAGGGDTGQQGYGVRAENARFVSLVVSGNTFKGHSVNNVWCQNNTQVITGNYFADGTVSSNSGTRIFAHNTGSGSGERIIARTSSFTFTGAEIERVATASGAITITLPDATLYSGRTYVVSNIGSGTVTVNATAGNVHGAASHSILAGDRGGRYLSNGTDWLLV